MQCLTKYNEHFILLSISGQCMSLCADQAADIDMFMSPNEVKDLEPGYVVDLQAYYYRPVSDGIPISVPADGDCLFSSMSMLLYGMIDRADELRYRTFLELVTNFNKYRALHAKVDCYNILANPYSSAKACISEHGWSDVITVAALASVTGFDIFLDPSCKLQQFLTEQELKVAELISSTIHYSGEYGIPGSKFAAIMFTKHLGGPGTRNHFLPLFPATLSAQTQAKFFFKSLRYVQQTLGLSVPTKLPRCNFPVIIVSTKSRYEVEHVLEDMQSHLLLQKAETDTITGQSLHECIYINRFQLTLFMFQEIWTKLLTKEMVERL